MEKLNNLDPSNFIILHLNKLEPKLEIGSTVYYDKTANYENIPLSSFINSVNSRYYTKEQDGGSMVFWEIIGFKISDEISSINSAISPS